MSENLDRIKKHKAAVVAMKGARDNMQIAIARVVQLEERLAFAIQTLENHQDFIPELYKYSTDKQKIKAAYLEVIADLKKYL